MSRRLEDVYVFITDNNGDEGIAAFWNPRLKRLEAMVAATEQRKDELLEMAQEMVSLHPEQPIRVVRFHQREDIAEVAVPSEGESA